MDDDAFVQASELSVLAPLTSGTGIEKVLADHDHHNEEPKPFLVQSVAQRSLLYFGS